MLKPLAIYLTIIENMWRTMKLSLEKRLNESKTRDELIRAVTDTWTTFTVEFIQELYRRLPRRMSAVSVCVCVCVLFYVAFNNLSVIHVPRRWLLVA